MNKEPSLMRAKLPGHVSSCKLIIICFSYGCQQWDFLSSHFTSPNDVSNSLSSLKRSLSSSSSSSTSRSPNQYCSRHAQNGSTDGDELSDTTQLLPTALFLNRLTNSKCATCIREALHSFCFDQVRIPNFVSSQ